MTCTIEQLRKLKHGDRLINKIGEETEVWENVLAEDGHIIKLDLHNWDFFAERNPSVRFLERYTIVEEEDDKQNLT